MCKYLGLYNVYYLNFDMVLSHFLKFREKKIGHIMIFKLLIRTCRPHGRSCSLGFSVLGTLHKQWLVSRKRVGI
jgi:hypothetical protein